ncbi:MAG: hypothetical protein NC350_05240 [Corallococcus sp.]|nr:hypothetical protein [Corallococcus sp.]
MSLTYDKLAVLSRLEANYAVIKEFAQKHPKLSYMQLDYSVVHEISLFTLEPDFSFEVLENKLDTMLSFLPAIKRIFAQPSIHLKEQNIILPTEAVRIVNNNTIQHVSSHSELWTDVTHSEIKPRKLLTRTYEDNYGIYENLVFCDVIDDILAFTRANLRIIQEFIYTNQTIEINFLERVNHLNYFLALGKLHTGYSRNFDLYYGIALSCLNKLQFIFNTIVPRLKCPVYKNNKLRSAKTKLRKTNILAMHKEYHQVYRLAKMFADGNFAGKSISEDVDTESLQNSYFYFTELLCIFAAGHFNFSCDENKQLNFSRLNVAFVFKNWQLKIKNTKLSKCSVLTFEVCKDTCYKVVLIPTVYGENTEIYNSVKAELIADEYIICCPYEDAKESHTTVDINNVESFRRIQQVILRAMVYADKTRDECPFCKNKLQLNERKSTPASPVYECTSCRTEIGLCHCPDSDRDYPYTKIGNFKQHMSFTKTDYLTARKREAKMYFRNITELTDDCKIVCPNCGKVHV